MRRVVWKYAIEGPRMFTLDMPNGAQVLHVALQGPSLYLWALVDPEAPAVERQFILAETGNVFQPRVLNAPTPIYIGTVHLHDGAYVLHLFDIGVTEETP